MECFRRRIRRMHKDLRDISEERKVLKDMELFVLDNSLRESTVGQLRGHTIEDKRAIYNEINKVGFQHIIVASFSHMTRVGDTFIKELHEKGEDFEKFYAFSELLESIDKDRMPDYETIPIGLRKCKELGIKHVIIEADLVYRGIDYTKFTDDFMFPVFFDRMRWARENLSKDSRILFNFRDFSDCMKKNPERLFKVVRYFSSLPPNERPFGLMYEETGKYLPEELGVWTQAVRELMDDFGFEDGHLLVHVHEQWGMQDSIQLDCLARGANGVWASLCIEGAAMGHSTSTVMLMNLVRLGNRKVLKQYNCAKLREAAINVTKITTGKPPAPKQVIYGERALDMVFGVPNFPPDDKNAFNMAEFFGEEPVMRMTTLASPGMIVHRLTNLFGKNPGFTEERGKRMLEVMLEDLHQNRKEEYMSKIGLAVLYDRSGGELTGEMADVVAGDTVKSLHAQSLLDKVRAMWDQWDLRDGERDDMLSFDSFYNGFLAPYFGCYRCDETKKALSALDMDADGAVDWKEFSLYLKWALRQYPNIADVEELLSVAFRKGLIPAMQDEALKQ